MLVKITIGKKIKEKLKELNNISIQFTEILNNIDLYH